MSNEIKTFTKTNYVLVQAFGSGRIDDGVFTALPGRPDLSPGLTAAW
jgi:hypothetical protein